MSLFCVVPMYLWADGALYTKGERGSRPPAGGGLDGGRDEDWALTTGSGNLTGEAT